MIAYVHAIRDNRVNVWHFKILRKFIYTLVSIVQWGSNKMKIFHIKA